MKDLDVGDLIDKALNSRSAEVFKYEWNHIAGSKKGELKFFFLKIRNNCDVIGDPNDDLKVKMTIDVVFGKREFNLSRGVIPPSAGQKFLIDSQKAIKNASDG